MFFHEKYLLFFKSPGQSGGEDVSSPGVFCGNRREEERYKVLFANFFFQEKVSGKLAAAAD
jgi:hypothetical protein